MYTAKCDICGVEVKPASTQAQANRNLGLHKRTAHGIPGKSLPAPHAQGIKKRIGRPPKNPELNNPERLAQLEEARKKRQEERLRAKRRAEQGRAHPLPLKECPTCGAQFFRKVGPKMEAMKLTSCDSCGLRFYYVKSLVEPTTDITGV